MSGASAVPRPAPNGRRARASRSIPTSFWPEAVYFGCWLALALLISAIAPIGREGHLSGDLTPWRKGRAMSKDRPGHVPAQNSDAGSADRLTASSRTEIDAFLHQVKSLGPVAKAGGRGRLLFALDATMSRQPTWDQACVLQAEMFGEAASVGGLDIQLIYYRGLSECRAS